MKKICFYLGSWVKCFSCWIFHLFLIPITLSSQQNLNSLIQKAPLIPQTIGAAFTQSKLEYQVEILEDGKEFKRVVSWDMNYELKHFDQQVSDYLTKWERKAQDNSFSLTYSPDNSPETKEYLMKLEKLADTTLEMWKPFISKVRDVNPDFLALSELDFGCDEIKASAKKLNEAAELKNKYLIAGREYISPNIDYFQRIFNRLILVEDAMMNNQVIYQMTRMLNILQEWNLAVISANSQMVDTGVSLNNGLCKAN
ncbi:MAG: hypothetical protein IPG87_16485 [Saprospiraceae bacterium]|nr:hypothetical protein [Candidatus Vicinibacter affinis]